MKFKDLFSDFFIVLLLFLIFSGSFALGHKFLFCDENFSGTLIIETEQMPNLYSSYLKEGDILYDTQTKRRVGAIHSVKVKEVGSGTIKFIIEVDAQRVPRASSLRSDKLWFTYNAQY